MESQSPSSAVELAELRRKFLELEERYASITTRLDSKPDEQAPAFYPSASDLELELVDESFALSGDSGLSLVPAVDASERSEVAEPALPPAPSDLELDLDDDLLDLSGDSGLSLVPAVDASERSEVAEPALPPVPSDLELDLDDLLDLSGDTEISLVPIVDSTEIAAQASPASPEPDVETSSGAANTPQDSEQTNAPAIVSEENQLPKVKPNERPGGAPFEWTIKGVKCVFRYCPAGAFIMGSPQSEQGRRLDEAQHEVEISRGFWLLETPVTQELWKAVVGSNPSFFKGATLPVERVSWEDCAKFVARLNKKGWFSRRLAPEGMAFDFPTEAEWEWACRALTTTPYNFGENLSNLAVNYDGELGQTTQVKKYAPNAWGLYDMHGNVWEWCSDWHGAYPSGAVVDPVGASTGMNRVLRGGCWFSEAPNCRSAFRFSDAPCYRNTGVGFRLLLRSSGGESTDAIS